MHAGILSVLNNRTGGTAYTNVSSRSITVQGSLSSNQLEELVRTANQHNANVALVAGVLTVSLN